MDLWTQGLTARLGQPLYTAGEELRFNCFKEDCGSDGTPDTKHHLYVNSITNKYFCHRHQGGGTLGYLAKLLDIPNPEADVSNFDKKINEFLFGDKIEEKQEEDRKSVV